MYIMNIIIPIGGLGERFKFDGYRYPKPLINILGNSMINHIIDNLHLSSNDNLIIIYNKELNNYNFDNLLKSNYDNLTLIELKKQTEGAAETVLLGLQQMNSHLLGKKCLLLDCDTIYYTNIIEVFRKQENNAIFCFKDHQEKPIYSYILFDENLIVSDIKEKVKISYYANTGCYCFRNGSILKQYCQKIMDENIREKNEFYTSCVIKKMLQDGEIFNANILNYSDVSCVGTPLQLKIHCAHPKIIPLKRICFDLDNTLVTSPKIKGDYTTVEPIFKNIEYLRFLKSQGHTIIIYTARRMKTHQGNVGSVLKDIALITFDTLRNFMIPYDEIYFGKPHADFYIDDLAVNAYEDIEKRIGFYKTCVEARDFNDIKSDSMDIIVKKSQETKLQGEIHYYQNIPNSLKHYFPVFIDYGHDWYSMQKINGITLSYLFTTESLTPELLEKYLGIFYEIHSHRIDTHQEINIYNIYGQKITERYSNYDYSVFENSPVIYEKLLLFFQHYQENKKGKVGLIHGDAVFSNAIITKDNEFKLIDMRGMINGMVTMLGDIFYDYGKIYQSLLGYDEILLNKYVSNQYKYKLIHVFESFIENKFGRESLYDIKMITNSLLFSLLPLHQNEKCFDFFKLINI